MVGPIRSRRLSRSKRSSLRNREGGTAMIEMVITLPVLLLLLFGML